MHDLPFPSKAMKGLKGVLKENGIVSMLDIDTSSDMVEQVLTMFNNIILQIYNLNLDFRVKNDH